MNAESDARRTPEIPELPPRPERPDCCGSGCSICVLEVYEDELARWEALVAERLRAVAAEPK